MGLRWGFSRVVGEGATLLGMSGANKEPGGELPKKEPDRYCNGRKRDGSGYCKRTAGAGTPHKGRGRCSRHGGSTKLAQRGADKEVAAELVQVYGLPVKVDPHSALLEELERTAGHVSWLFIKVQETAGTEDGEGLVGPVGQEGPSESGGWHHASVEPSVWLRLYQEERKHLVKVAADCIKAGIEERRVRIAEAQGMLIARAIQGILLDLGVADDPRAPEIVRKHLTALSEGQASANGETLPELEAQLVA